MDEQPAQNKPTIAFPIIVGVAMVLGFAATSIIGDATGSRLLGILGGAVVAGVLASGTVAVLIFLKRTQR